MVQYNVNDLLRVIGIKELTIIQLRLENLRLTKALDAATQERSSGCDGEACSSCQHCQQEKGGDETKKS